MIDALRRRVASAVSTLRSGGSLTARTVTGGVWVASINASDRLLQLGMVIVLARLLPPSEFGLMALALLSLNGLRRVSRLGLDDALVQRDEDDVDHCLDTVFSLRVARGVALAGVLFVAAPAVAAAFGNPRVAPLVRAIALVPLVLGVQNPGVVYWRKRLEFHRQFVYALVSRVAEVTVAVGYAVVSPTVWALMAGFLVGAVVKLIASYAIHGYRPRPGFDAGIAAELFGYGRWIFASTLLALLAAQGDDAFVGWLLGASALGLYQVAYRFSNAPATEITHTVSDVVFPAYAKVRDDVALLRKGYLDTVQLVTFVTFPASVGLVVVAPSFVSGVLGPGWSAMVLPMQLLAAYGLVRSVRSTTTPLFRAAGRPDYETKLRVAKLALVAVPLYPAATRWGLPGVALVVVGASLVVAPATAVLSLRLVDARPRQLASRLVYPAAGSLVMGVLVLAVRSRLAVAPPLATLVVLVATGVACYALVMLGFERRFDYGIGDLLGTIRGAIA